MRHKLGLQQPAAAARSAPNGGRWSSPDRAAQLPRRADAESRRQAAPLLCLREGAATTND